MKRTFPMFVLLLYGKMVIEASGRCDRSVESALRPKNTEEIDKYVIEIDGDPTSYEPGKTYSVILKYNPILDGVHMFREFMLSVEQEKLDSGLKAYEVHVGYLKLSDDMLSTFSRKCENTILQTSSVPKSSIEVYWVAPSSGSGCVAFRATVVESKESWFSEEGSLTKILCEETSENADSQPPTLDECTACDDAKYELVFEGLWTRNTHPKDYPSNIWYTKFGDIVGASHANNESFWQYGGIASDSLRSLGESSDSSGLQMELKEKMGKTVRTIIKANGLRYPNITGKTFAFFRVDKNNHLVSIATKIIPSPDWILGVSDFELCTRDGNWADQRVINLYPWDIGTDDGKSYNSPREPCAEPGPIEKIKPDDKKSPFYDPEGKEMKPFAKLYLTKVKTYKMECEPEEILATTTEELEGTTEEGKQEGDCVTGPWSDWSPCSATCGPGFKFKNRKLEAGDEDNCTEPLVQYESCTGKKCKANENKVNLLPGDDPRCALTAWSEWSSCSSACGKGTETRDKKFKHPENAAQCENNDPLILQENADCNGTEKECPANAKDIDCTKEKWSPWTPCNVTCGTGAKTRLRMPKSEEDEEANESECSNMEEVQCYEPECEETTTIAFGNIMSLNQMSTDNVFSQPFGPVVNCIVSDWSVWGPCELTRGKCGKGYRTQHRQILQHTMNGGKSCPKKLMKKRICKISCHRIVKDEVVSTSTTTTQPTTETMETTHSEVETTTEENIDCIMSDWSQWSPCSISCGGSSVQQRTRSIRRPPKKNGKPCGIRLDQRACPLPLACSDKGMPII